MQSIHNAVDVAQFVPSGPIKVVLSFFGWKVGRTFEGWKASWNNGLSWNEEWQKKFTVGQIKEGYASFPVLSFGIRAWILEKLQTGTVGAEDIQNEDLRTFVNEGVVPSYLQNSLYNTLFKRILYPVEFLEDKEKSTTFLVELDNYVTSLSSLLTEDFSAFPSDQNRSFFNDSVLGSVLDFGQLIHPEDSDNNCSNHDLPVMKLQHLEEFDSQVNKREGPFVLSSLFEGDELDDFCEEDPNMDLFSRTNSTGKGSCNTISSEGDSSENVGSPRSWINSSEPSYNLLSRPKKILRKTSIESHDTAALAALSGVIINNVIRWAGFTDQKYAHSDWSSYFHRNDPGFCLNIKAQDGQKQSFCFDVKQLEGMRPQLSSSDLGGMIPSLKGRSIDLQVNSSFFRANQNTRTWTSFSGQSLFLVYIVMLLYQNIFGKKR